MKLYWDIKYNRLSKNVKFFFKYEIRKMLILCLLIVIVCMCIYYIECVVLFLIIFNLLNEICNRVNLDMMMF